MTRYELTDDEWNLLKGLFPTQKSGGRWYDHRTTLNGMLWILRSGASWRDLSIATKNGRAFIIASTAGDAKACSIESLRPCRFDWTSKARSTGIYGSLTAPMCVPLVPRPGH